MSHQTSRTPTTRSRRVAQVLSGAALTGLVLAGATAEAHASSKPVKIGNTSVSLRDCYHPSKQSQPSQSCTYKTTLAAGTPVTLVCQHTGQNIYGDNYWDYVKTPSNGYGYVADYYVNTGTSSYRVPGVDYCNY